MTPMFSNKAYAQKVNKVYKLVVDCEDNNQLEQVFQEYHLQHTRPQNNSQWPLFTTR